MILINNDNRYHHHQKMEDEHKKNLGPKKTILSNRGFETARQAAKRPPTEKPDLPQDMGDL